MNNPDAHTGGKKESHVARDDAKGTSSVSVSCDGQLRSSLPARKGVLEIDGIVGGRSLPSSKQSVVGNSNMNLQQFNDGRKIIASHTSIAEM